MFIKSIILDGFKSYAQRTEISGFDINFNAITGLNGSGKSNILDSICFLLGITNLSQVRATNLQQLIYKNGQAGVTKATVTITFDNTDRNQSPIGYESHKEITISRQIVLGGRNKYLINGSNAKNNQVQDLFRSVQLNVNNPHFLIMQGRITKVLNMKPPEILAMIEEAAGTKMYDSKKQVAMKTMEKKQTKLNELQTILDDEINPTIQKLKEERASYLEYQKVNREWEHLTKLTVAYEFVKAKKYQSKSVEELEKMNLSIQTLKEQSDQMEKRIKEIDGEIRDLQRKKDAESGGKLKEGEIKLDGMVKCDVKLSSDVNHAQLAVTGEQKKEIKLKNQIVEHEKHLKEKETAILDGGKILMDLEKQSKDDETSVLNAQSHYHAVSAGLSSNDDGEDKTLTDQLMDCKNRISNAETDTKQAKLKLKDSQSQLKPKRNDLKATEKEYEKDSASLKTMQNEIKKLDSQREKCNFDKQTLEDLLASKNALGGEINNLQEDVDSIESRFPQLQFDYKDPSPGFKRDSVKGLVCRLIKVKDVKMATSLEVIAGGKLFNVVIDNEKTGKALLQKGELKRRVTFIPLNKIASRSIDANIVNKAKSLVGADNCHTALSLVGYEKEVDAAMKFVFGSTFVCESLDQAKEAAFKTNHKTVTIEGDVFDPAGTLSGGSRRQGPSFLQNLDNLHVAVESLKAKQKELQKVMKEISNQEAAQKKDGDIVNRLDLLKQQLGLAEERIRLSTHHAKLEEVKQLEQAIEDQKELITSSETILQQETKKVTDLEAKMKEAKSHREKELVAAENAITQAKSKADESKKNYKQKEQEITGLKLETEELTSDMENLHEQVKLTLESIATLEKAAKDLEEKSLQSKTEIQTFESELQEHRDLLKACGKEISDKMAEKSKCAKNISDSEFQTKKINHEITKCNKESEAVAYRVEQLLSDYEWIASEQNQFGVANTIYDFNVNDPKDALKRLDKLQETKEKLKKKVNTRAMTMLGKAEEKYHDIMKKKRIVDGDRKKIEDVITDLDEKKNHALRVAWEQVNEDFGSIFSALLPGTNAKLSPPEGQSILEGLEVKVAFGNVWKESLTELSGGQRSLVALSLILAMLRFKPAPIYILDEVDAALDLSHTQNIGQMLRAHFKSSQFIVVSLKDGMFNNANVLFKTKFVDGLSTVSRHIQAQPTSKHAEILPSKKARPAPAKRTRINQEQSA